MSAQPDLFRSLPPATHRVDPPSAAEAERRHTRSGRRARNLERVREALRQLPGHTGAELAASMGMDTYEVRRRLSDLKNRGEAKQGPPRECDVAGTRAATWYAT